jgi:hypothetical protein
VKIAGNLALLRRPALIAVAFVQLIIGTRGWWAFDVLITRIIEMMNG